MKRLDRWLPPLVVGLLLWKAAPPWPESWDGLGFLASIARFDMAQFSPHPPGYPVYVALLRVAAWCTRDHVAAANAVAVLSGVTTAFVLAALFRRVFGPTPATFAGTLAAAVVTCPLVFRSFSAIGSEGPALACAAIVALSFTPESPLSEGVLGVAVGLGLGVRVSWAPLFLGAMLLVPASRRARAWGFATVTSLSWAVPLLLIVGPRHFAELSWMQASGHATRWGGSILTEHSRLGYLARDVFVDGFGVGTDALGVAIGVALAAACIVALHAWKRASFRWLREGVIAFGPYLVWVAVGQNLRQEPRHAVPFVVAIAVLLAVASRIEQRARTVACALFVLVALRTAKDTLDRSAVPPTGEQLVALVDALPDPSRTAVFGGASVRYFELSNARTHAVVAGSVGDVLLALGVLDHRPDRVLVTDELDDFHRWFPGFSPIALMTRPPRLDRKNGPLGVYDVSALVWSLR